MVQDGERKKKKNRRLIKDIFFTEGGRRRKKSVSRMKEKVRRWKGKARISH